MFTSGPKLLMRRGVATSHIRIAVLSLLTIGGNGCANPLGPNEAGLAAPKGPGKVVVRVRDQLGAALRNVYVTVEEPNNVGSFFKEGTWTGADGVTTFWAVPAGRRPVEVTPPMGFSAGPGGMIREVDVVKSASVTVEFQLTRN